MMFAADEFYGSWTNSWCVRAIYLRVHLHGHIIAILFYVVSHHFALKSEVNAAAVVDYITLVHCLL